MIIYILVDLHKNEIADLSTYIFNISSSIDVRFNKVNRSTISTKNKVLTIITNTTTHTQLNIIINCLI